MPKITYRNTHTERDANGKETKTSEDKGYRYDSEPPHIKIYLQDVLYLADMPGRYNSLLRALFCRLGWDNRIVLNAALKRIIANEIGATLATVDNYLTDLVKGDILIREDKGLFVLNPYYFGKGKWTDIEDLRIEINYTPQKGRTFATTITYKDEVIANKAASAQAKTDFAAAKAARAITPAPEPEPEEPAPVLITELQCKLCKADMIYHPDGRYGPYFTCPKCKNSCGAKTSATASDDTM